MTRLLDIAIVDDLVELIFSDRRIVFSRDGDRRIWAIASRPPHARDGSGYVSDEITTATIIARGIS